MKTPIVILCGGKGSRLKSVVSDRPKPLALINGRPFLDILLAKLVSYEPPRLILSVGYMANFFRKYIEDYGFKGRIELVEEQKQLGTGGAINFVSNFLDSESMIVLNGDTFCDVDLAKFEEIGTTYNSSVVAVNWVNDTSRYGRVKLDSSNSFINKFTEKGVAGGGLINTGVYFLLKRDILDQEVYSFEEKLLPSLSMEGKLRAFVTSSAFIDIGVPSDYERAQIFFEEKK